MLRFTIFLFLPAIAHWQEGSIPHDNDASLVVPGIGGDGRGRGESIPWSTLDTMLQRMTANNIPSANYTELNLNWTAAAAQVNQLDLDPREAVVVVTCKVNEVFDRLLTGLEKLDEDKYKLYVFYDEACLNSTSANEIRKRRRIEVQSFDRDTEKEALGMPYLYYSGIHLAASKPYQLRWLANHGNHERAWFLEEDVYMNGDWNELFDSLSSKKADFVLPKLKQECDWGLWDNGGWELKRNLCLHGLIAIHRMSKTLAVHMWQYLMLLKAGGYTAGHHESMILLLCIRTDECKVDVFEKSTIGKYKFTPDPPIDTRLLEYGKIYHPVKEWTGEPIEQGPSVGTK